MGYQNPYGLTPPPEAALIPSAANAPPMGWDPRTQALMGMPGMTIAQAATMASQAQQAQDQVPAPAAAPQQDDQQKQVQYQPQVMPAPMSEVPQTRDQRARAIGIADFPADPASVYSDEYVKTARANAQAALDRQKVAADAYQNEYEHPHRIAAMAAGLLQSRRGVIAPMIGGLISGAAGKDLTTRKAQLDFAKGEVESSANALAKADEGLINHAKYQLEAEKALMELNKGHGEAAMAAAKLAQYPADAAATRAKKQADAKAAEKLANVRDAMAQWLGPKAWSTVEKNLASAGKSKAETAVIPGNAQASQFHNVATGEAALVNANTAQKGLKLRERGMNAHIEHLAWLEKHGDALDDNAKNGQIMEAYKGLASMESIFSVSDPETQKKLGPDIMAYRDRLKQLTAKLGLPAAPPGTVAVGPAKEITTPQPQQKPLQAQQAQAATPNALPPPEQRADLIKRAKAGDPQAKAQLVILIHQIEQASAGSPEEAAAGAAEENKKEEE